MSAGVCIERVSSLGAGKVGKGEEGLRSSTGRRLRRERLGRVRAGTRDGSLLKLWLLGCS